MIIGVVVIMFVMGAAGLAGLFYVGHRVREKVQEMKVNLSDTDTRGSTNSTSPAANSSGANPCRYLSQADVGKAIGIEIVRVQAEGEGCSYLAVGTQADMTAKHVAALSRSSGADAKSQKMAEQVAGAMFKSFAAEEKGQSRDNSGTVPVMVVSVQERDNADAEMQLNAKVMGRLGPGTPGLEGIGNEAFVTGDSMMMIRKDNKLIRIMYMTCPCGTNEIKPLARKLVAAL